jgi:hypothetical protein
MWLTNCPDISFKDKNNNQEKTHLVIFEIVWKRKQSNRQTWNYITLSDQLTHFVLGFFWYFVCSFALVKPNLWWSRFYFFWLSSRLERASRSRVCRLRTSSSRRNSLTSSSSRAGVRVLDLARFRLNKNKHSIIFAVLTNYYV